VKPSLVLSLTLLLGSGCVLDRTGQSITSQAQRELAIQSSRMDEQGRLSEELERRVEQAEEVIRYRGQRDARELENLEGVIHEVQRMRGDLEVLQHEARLAQSQEGTFREDTDYRLGALETRADQLEGALGLSPPPQALPQEEVEGEGPSPASVEEEASGDSGPAEEPSGDLYDLAAQHLAEDRPLAARAVLDRFLQSSQDDPRFDEARYRYAETWFVEGLYQQAILKYEEVVSSDQESEWAAWAMVRQGECFRRLGREREAELFWEDVLARYPDNEAAELARSLLDR
jgi:TolA-binding protein